MMLLHSQEGTPDPLYSFMFYNGAPLAEIVDIGFRMFLLTGCLLRNCP